MTSFVPKDLSRIFNKFVGQEIPMVEKKVGSDLGTPNEVVIFEKMWLADIEHPTLLEMKKAADDNGLKLRLWWPGSAGTDDVQPKRVNAYLEKSPDGKYRVQDSFKLG